MIRPATILAILACVVCLYLAHQWDEADTQALKIQMTFNPG